MQGRALRWNDICQNFHSRMYGSLLAEQIAARVTLCEMFANGTETLKFAENGCDKLMDVVSGLDVENCQYMKGRVFPVNIEWLLCPSEPPPMPPPPFQCINNDLWRFTTPSGKRRNCRWVGLRRRRRCRLMGRIDFPFYEDQRAFQACPQTCGIDPGCSLSN